MAWYIKKRATLQLAMTFLAQNLPPLHIFDAGRCVREWRKQGHLLPYNANNRAGEVLSRFRGTVERVGKFMLVKGSIWPTGAEPVAPSRHKNQNSNILKLKHQTSNIFPNFFNYCTVFYYFIDPTPAFSFSCPSEKWV